MAFSKKLTESQHKIVDARIGEMISTLLKDNRVPEKIESGEVFCYYMLGFEDIRAQNPIHKSARDIGHFIHLLYVDGKPYYHAVSGPDKDKEWEVHAVVNSELSYRLNDAIDWADQNLPQEAEIVVLNIPALYLQFLWLKDPENPIFYALSWQNEDAIFLEQRRFTEPELRKVLFSLGGPRGVKLEGE